MSSFRKLFKILTLEPFIVLFVFIWFIQSGVKIRKNLLMWKICKIELNYTENICNNLSQHNETQSEVQINLNNFEMV